MEALRPVKLDGLHAETTGSKPATSFVTVWKNPVTDRNQEPGRHLVAP
ncbi:MAG: hypothetical protein QOH35_2599 [Acidobacteriaceae bacterium]|jgi:hypothetical protein|nr:hypothetical protein [Acidobacteriaceae bacterium]MEA2260213.1 hypothetical protein [Acidobacteriaceae bacterium]MEA2541233.1 hypothetical protein [Acidobacteriaceae bacterium]MEA3006369.1 hypothetical protein [Acidobacteriaceae bacterium]